MKFFFLLFSCLILGLSSCRYDKENIPVPSNACDTLNVSYSSTVKVIIQNNCYSCHSTSAVIAGNGGLDLENWTSLKNYLTQTYRGDGIYGSKFFHVIEQYGLVPHMPPTGKLSDCDLSQIRSWLRDGGPAN